MEFFRIKRDIPFMRHALVLNVISLVTFLAAVAFLAVRGLHFSIEFTGGTVMEVAYPQAADIEQVRGTVGGLGFSEVQVQNFGTARDVMIRLPVQKGVTSAQQSEQVMTALKAATPGVELRRVEFVGPQVGKELATDGALALLFVVVGISRLRRETRGLRNRWLRLPTASHRRSGQGQVEAANLPLKLGIPNAKQVQSVKPDHVETIQLCMNAR